ncbi:hypothetical protein EB233_14610 [Mesorhizobium erdmanii]|uniref:Uncharacterized protein n=1 Tax=Mesorhizobium erdmanii TaxID=1777866 RepID=A0A6M7UKF3_9HYPH|nr:hypothetical protein EB233_14610 [Mesorhizobium erdmanii]
MIVDSDAQTRFQPLSAALQERLVENIGDIGLRHRRFRLQMHDPVPARGLGEGQLNAPICQRRRSLSDLEPSDQQRTRPDNRKAANQIVRFIRPSLHQAGDDLPVRPANAMDGDDIAGLDLQPALNAANVDLLSRDPHPAGDYAFDRPDHLAGHMYP